MLLPFSLRIDQGSRRDCVRRDIETSVCAKPFSGWFKPPRIFQKEHRCCRFQKDHRLLQALQIAPPAVQRMHYRQLSVTNRRTMADQVGTFSCLAEGEGGTFRFDPRISPPHIGTAELKTSVGVYFPLPENCCFVAHIYVTPKGHPNPETGLTRALSAAENQAVRTLISGKLTQHASVNEWTPRDVVDSIQVGKRAYVMCPIYSRPVESPGLPGTAVIKGIEDFLGPGGRLIRYINNDRV